MEYWNNRYSDGGKIWGTEPSQTAKFALRLFKSYDIRNVLISGSGYGRHTKYFSENNYNITGLEISETAVKIARELDNKSEYILGSVLDFPLKNQAYDAIFCYNVLHLLLENDRVLFIENCYRHLRNKGLVFFSVFSDQESSFSKGVKIEENTFESKLYRPTHYFTEMDILNHFKLFTIIKTEMIKEKEDHGNLGPHTHKLRYIFAEKK
jgi:SAM-dependent methyltransferase